MDYAATDYELVAKCIKGKRIVVIELQKFAKWLRLLQFYMCVEQWFFDRKTRELAIVETRFSDGRYGFFQDNPLAPESTKVSHADPHQAQHEARRSAIHTLILEQDWEHCEKGKGWLSIHFSKMAKRDFSVAKNIMSHDLEISVKRWGQHQSSFSELFIIGNGASLACKAARQVELLLRRSDGTCGTTYWITLVLQEATDAEAALM
ncbi:hypothetical protein QQP08_023774 [Theobroma cacao]|nr:hypothetical protein QQP08_023774 [Theobroma cacao]